MAIDFNQYLTREQKEALIQQRLQQFAAEAFQHEINRKVAIETGNTDAAAIAVESLQILEKAIEVHATELASLTE